MSYKVLFLVLALCWQCLTLTDLSLTQCPTGFNSTTLNSSLPNGFGYHLFKAFHTLSSRAQVDDIVLKGDNAALQTHLIGLSIPYILWALVFGVLLLGLISWCLFTESCPPCAIFRRDVLADPYSKKELRVTAWLGFFLTISVCLLCVFALISIPPMQKSLSNTSCSIYRILDKSINGDSQKNWAGFLQLQEQIGNTSSFINSIVSQISTYFTGDDWLTDEMLSMKYRIAQVYETYKTSQLVSPNTAKTASARLANQPAPQIDSLFIKRSLGPVSSAKSMTGEITLKLMKTQIVSDAGYAVQQAARQVVDSKGSIQVNSAATQNNLFMYLNQLYNVQTDLNQFRDDYFNNLASTGFFAVEIVLGLTLASSLILLIGMVATYFFETTSCRSVIQTGWVFMALCYFGLIGCCYLFLSVGSISFNFCSFYQDVLSSPEQFSRINAAYNQNILSKFKTCLHEGGDTLVLFRIKQEMDSLYKLFQKIDVYLTYEDVKLSSYINKQESITSISSWMAKMNRYQLGKDEDSLPEITNNDNPKFALKSLNLYTFTGGGLNTCTSDNWVYDATSCNDPSQTVYRASTTDNALLLSKNPVTCFSFNERFDTTKTKPWTEQQFVRRYVNTRLNCQQAFDTITPMAATIIAYRDSRIQLFKNIEADLKTVYDSHVDFVSLMAGFKERIMQFNIASSNVRTVLMSSSDGLYKSRNCGVLGDQLRLTYNIYCGNFMHSVHSIAGYIMLLMFAALGSLFLTAILGVRIFYVERQMEIDPTMDKLSDNSVQMEEPKSEPEEDSP